MLLQLQRGQIDLGGQDISLEWRNIRFSDGLRSAFTTDITIPANHTNLNVLDASGLLDSPNQKFGDYLTPANLTLHDIAFDVLVQVVSVNDDEIVLTLFEDIIPSEFFNKKITDYFTDDDNSIYVWSTNTPTAEPSVFQRYYYGMPYNDRYAQYHASVPLNSIITDINAQSGYQLQQVDADLRLVATKKTVCPQNKRQVIHCWCDDASSNSIKFKLSGGQHIVNDLGGVDYDTQLMASDTTKITFNRHCNVTGYLYYSMRGKAVGSLPSGGRVIGLRKNGQFLDNRLATWNGTRCGIGVLTLNHYTFEAGDELEIVASNPQYNKFFQVILDLEYSDYQIDDEDYGIDLTYCKNHPTLYFFPSTDIDDRQPLYFDYRTYTVDVGGGTFVGLFLPYRGYNYFGTWCNMPDLTLKDLLTSMCWYMGKKPKLVNHQLLYVDPNDSSDLRLANITNKKPTSDILARHTVIGYTNDEHPTDITFQNHFIEEERDIYRSVFQYVGEDGEYAELDQYSIEEDNDEVKVSFDEVNAVIVRDNNGGRLLAPHDLSDLGIGRLTTVMGVDIETYDDVKDLDYVYLDGRKYLVVNGEYEVQSHLSTLNCLLISTAVPTVGNTILVPAIIGVEALDKKPAIGYRITTNAELTTAIMRVYKIENTPSVNIDKIENLATSAKISISAQENSSQTLVYETKITKKEGIVEFDKIEDGNYFVELQALANKKYKKSTYYFNIEQKEL